jgi:hypothetical protein
MDLGYHVTLVNDATAAFSKEMMHAAHDLNGPSFAHKILTTAELRPHCRVSDSATSLLRRRRSRALEERQQVGVDLVRVGRGHAMRKARVDLQRCVL